MIDSRNATCKEVHKLTAKIASKVETFKAFFLTTS